MIRLSLMAAVTGATEEQIESWDRAIPWLQSECDGVSDDVSSAARSGSAVLEYTLPIDERRPDVLLLGGGAVVVLEVKGRREPTRADLDQVSTYARDLRQYHADCASRCVVPVLVPDGADACPRRIHGVTVVGPADRPRVVRVTCVTR